MHEQCGVFWSLLFLFGASPPFGTDICLCVKKSVWRSKLAPTSAAFRKKEGGEKKKPEVDVAEEDAPTFHVVLGVCSHQDAK